MTFFIDITNYKITRFCSFFSFFNIEHSWPAYKFHASYHKCKKPIRRFFDNVYVENSIYRDMGLD